MCILFAHKENEPQKMPRVSRRRAFQTLNSNYEKHMKNYSIVMNTLSPFLRASLK